VTRLVALLLVAGCGSSSITAISLTPPRGGQLAPEARGIVWMWGTDANVADVGATLIDTYDQRLTGAGLAIDVPENAHELIDQGFGPVSAENARFYFDVFVDQDADGELCPGDLRQDFEVTAFETYPVPPQTLSVALSTIPSSEACRSIVP
jgi:hypothetical protein